MITFGERLKAAREHAKLNQETLGQRVGLTQGQISKLERGERTDTLKIVELAAATGVNLHWLREGNGEMLEPPSVEIGAHADYPSIPLVKFKISAGASGFEVGFLDDNADPIVFRRSWFVAKRYDPTKLFAIRVAGSSMETSLFDGDIVVINTAARQTIDGEVFAVNYEGELVVKRTIRTGGEWVLASDNPDKRRYPDKPIHDGVFVIGRVVHRQSERI